MNLIKKIAIWLVPVLIVLAITPFTPLVDMDVATWAYNDYWGPEASQSRSSAINLFFKITYSYGVVPAQLVCGGAFLLLLWSYFKPQSPLKKIRGPLLVLVLSLVIGSGIIAHSILKEWWGRPRPKQVIEFGGSQQFRPYYLPTTKRPYEPSKSFPSGHSTMGYYFFALYFIGRRNKNKSLAIYGLLIGLSLGITLSIARIMQGGHFVSDVLLAALIMWLSAYASDYLVYKYSYLWNGNEDPYQKAKRNF